MLKSTCPTVDSVEVTLVKEHKNMMALKDLQKIHNNNN